MGTVFQVPWARLHSWPGDLQVLKDHGFTVAALELTPDAEDVDVVAARNPDKLALVLGTEGAGMSAGTLAPSTSPLKSPCATAWIPSTWRLPQPWLSGSCAPATDAGQQNRGRAAHAFVRPAGVRYDG